MKMFDKKFDYGTVAFSFCVKSDVKNVFIYFMSFFAVGKIVPYCSIPTRL